MARELFVAELGDHGVPRGGVAQRGCGDPSAPGADEESRIGVACDDVHPSLDEFADSRDQRDFARTFALSVLVHQATRRWGGLAAHRPYPLVGVDVAHQASGHFADAGGGARLEDDCITPTPITARRPGDECIGEGGEGSPVRERKCPWIVELVLGELVLALPTGDFEPDCGQ